MTAAARKTPDAEAEAERLQQVVKLLGGGRVLHRQPRDSLAAHELLVRGLPGRAVVHLLEGLRVLETRESAEKGLGMSLRTYQRHKDSPDRMLDPGQSGRTWKFAEILAKATTVFGSQERAEQWLEKPATGLDRRRPIDLLATPAGLQLVEDFLERLETGVYA
ncbi:type II toxin-antitoxin system Xre/ParS family antitoxin [Reyranella sp.]|jgi:putative toxin-antitoxin system antitoxin component (TIGR02293 family)|uniref:type II RES/Xre toxin-antitoxin system antitoxin n=1 Tax=Reyranella sp. TaxID=1929291 RepID=UPI002F920F01